jgi:hypothetical protein
MDLHSNDMDVLTTLASAEPVPDVSTSEAGEVGENAAAAAFGAPVAAAETALQELCERAGKNLARADLRISAEFDDVMPQVYAAIVSLEESGSCEAFLAARGIKTHGNVRNAVSPVLRALANTKHKHMRAWLAKYACVIALARREGISPNEFLGWRKSVTVEEACKKWRELQRAQDGLEQEVADTSTFRKLQSAWERATDEEQSTFLAQNNLVRCD